MTRLTRKAAVLAAPLVIAGTVLFFAAAPADAQTTGNTQGGTCSMEQTWVNTDGQGDIQVLGTDDGGVYNWMTVAIESSPGGQQLTEATNGPNWGLPAHTFVESPWIYVGSGTTVWVWSFTTASIPSVGSAPGCTDGEGSAFWVTA